MKAGSDHDPVIKDDLVCSLERMHTLMHNPSRSRCLFASLAEAIRRLVNAKMEDTESLISCDEKVKQAKDTLKSHVGTKILDEFVTHAEECKKQWQMVIQHHKRK